VSPLPCPPRPLKRGRGRECIGLGNRWSSPTVPLPPAVSSPERLECLSAGGTPRSPPAKGWSALSREPIVPRPLGWGAPGGEWSVLCPTFPLLLPRRGGGEGIYCRARGSRTVPSPPPGGGSRELSGTGDPFPPLLPVGWRWGNCRGHTAMVYVLPSATLPAPD
jgi:hypothetical protein